MSGPIVGDACGPPWAPPARFPASGILSEHDLFVRSENIIGYLLPMLDKYVGSDIDVENALVFDN